MSTIAFLFPGQGAQYVGMGKDLAAELPAARELFERADEILGYSLSEICFHGPESQLHATDRSQPALYVCSMAALEKLKRDQPEVVARCQAAAGLSLGEYTAMVFAGAIDFADGLQLVQARGRAMQQASERISSGMVSILGLDESRVTELCDAARGSDEILQIANYLCPGNIVISGHQEACGRAIELAPQHGAMRAVPLTVAGAFHTEIMRPAVAQLEAALADVEIKPLRIPVYSNVDAQSHQSPAELQQILISQVCSPVLWQNTMNAMIEAGCTQFYEVGAGKVLKGLLKRIDRKLDCQLVGA